MAAEAAATARRLRRRIAELQAQPPRPPAQPAPRSDGRLAELSAQLDERTRAAELASAEWRRLEEEVRELTSALAQARRGAMSIPLPTPGFVLRLTSAERKLRCPRCFSPMTEYTHAIVRADKCDECFGIFFDNGELELVIAKTVEERDAQWATWGDLFRRK